MSQENCVSCAFRTHNLQSSPDLMQASGQGALTTAPYQPTKSKRKISIDKDKNGKDSLFKDISEIEYFNCRELNYYTKKYPNLSKKKLKKG